MSRLMTINVFQNTHSRCLLPWTSAGLSWHVSFMLPISDYKARASERKRERVSLFPECSRGSQCHLKRHCKGTTFSSRKQVFLPLILYLTIANTLFFTITQSPLWASSYLTESNRSYFYTPLSGICDHFCPNVG